MKIEDFLNKLGRNVVDYQLSDDVLHVSDLRASRLMDAIKKLADVQTQEKYIQSIVRKPSNENGDIYELLVYKWLFRHHIRFDMQPKLDVSECLKRNAKDYTADGLIEDIVFDIKAFSFGMPRYAEFYNQLNDLLRKYGKTRLKDFLLDNTTISEETFNKYTFKIKDAVLSDYYITVSGDANLSSEGFKGKLRGNEKNILTELFSIKPNYTDFILVKNGLEIRAWYMHGIKDQ